MEQWWGCYGAVRGALAAVCRCGGSRANAGAKREPDESVGVSSDLVRKETALVRRAHDGDEALLRSLYMAFAEELAPPAFLREDWKEIWPIVKTAIRRGSVVIAEADQTPIGYAVVEAQSYDRERLRDLFVHKSWRGQGIARMLLLAVLEHLDARGTSWLLLEVATDNEQARAMYESWGFQSYEMLMAARCDALKETLRRNSEELR
jgi:ribosomal protein S18 acetylase RimI-like enzyme